MKWKFLTVWMLTLFLLVSLASAVGTAPNSADVMFYYKLDESSGSTVFDETANSYDSTISSVTLGATGKIGTAYDFESSSGNYFSRSSFSEMEMSSFTVGFWIKPESSSSPQYVVSFGRGLISYVGWHVILNADNTITFFTSGDTSPYYNNMVSTETVPDGEWSYVVVVYNGVTKNGSIYIDNVEKDFSSLKTITYSSSFRNFVVGNRADTTGTNYWVDGVVDELFVANVAFTDDNVAYLFNTGSPSTAQQYPFSTPASSNFTFRLTSGTGLSLDWGNGTVLTNSTGSEIKTGILRNDTTNTESFTLFKTNHFNITVTDYNTTQDYNFTYLEYPYVNVSNTINNSQVTYFNISIDGTNYSSNSTGKVYVPFNTTKNYILYATNYITTSSSHNFANSNDLQTTLTPSYYVEGAYYSNYKTSGAKNYTINLTYTFGALCPAGETHTASLMVGGVARDTISIVCDSTINNNTGSYVHTNQATQNVYLAWSATSQTTSNKSFTWDLEPPEITVLTFYMGQGFNNNTANISMRCTDTLHTNLKYGLKFNTENLYYNNETNNTLIYNSSNTATYGTNTVYGNCTDLFYTTSEETDLTVYASNFFLIDELSNAPPSFSNFISAIVYYDDNTTSYDLKTNNATQINFSSTYQNRLRFEFIYKDLTQVTRYIDVGYFADGQIRVCANENNHTYQTQLFGSNSAKPIIVKSVYTRCVIAADTTRFAYQDAQILRAQTINQQYYLYTYDDDDQVYLASIDGSLSVYTDLDQLEFSQTAYNINVLSDKMTFQKVANGTIKIYYKDPRQDNTAAHLLITRLDTGDVVFNDDGFDDPNEFIMYLNSVTWLNVTNQTLLKAVLNITNTDGTSTSHENFFNLNAKNGMFSSQFAFFASLTLAFFGLTFVASRNALGWFGVIILLIAIALSTFGIPTTNLVFLQGMEVIMLVFVSIVMMSKNYSAVT